MVDTKNIVGEIPDILDNQEGLYEGDLRYYFAMVCIHAKNKYAPYHNLRHMLHVFVMCHEALRYYKSNGAPLDKMEARKILIAALCHDVNNTARNDSDDVNITLALKFLKQYYLGIDIENYAGIEQLIRWTEFPHKTDGYKMSLAGQILIDADRMQALSPVWIQETVLGLAQEWGVNEIIALKKNISFHQRLFFSTEWAKTVFPQELVNQKIREAERYLAIYEHYR